MFKIEGSVILALAISISASAVPLQDRKLELSKRATLPKLGGVNLAGFDFGCGIDGTCTAGSADVPADGFKAQLTYFNSIGANLFRLPFGWQYVVSSVSDMTLTGPTWTSYQTAVTNCLAGTPKEGGSNCCLLDVHNYARWNGALIGASGAPTAADFATFWGNIATIYAKEPNVIFSLMNEPHDLTSVSDWATIMQGAVTAIRAAGATSQYIVLNGNDFTHAQDWLDGTNDPILNVTDSNGGTDLLLLDIHEYLDANDSGAGDACTTDNAALFQSVQTFMAGIGRTAIVTETGVPNVGNCVASLKTELSTILQQPNIAGYSVWAAGQFGSGYALSVFPVDAITTGALVPNLPPSGLTGSAVVTPDNTTVVASSLAPSAAVATPVVSTTVAASSLSSVVLSSLDIATASTDAAVATTGIPPLDSSAIVTSPVTTATASLITTSAATGCPAGYAPVVSFVEAASTSASADPGGPIVTQPAGNPGGPVVNATNINPGGPIISATTVNPGGPISTAISVAGSNSYWDAPTDSTGGNPWWSGKWGGRTNGQI